MNPKGMRQGESPGNSCEIQNFLCQAAPAASQTSQPCHQNPFRHGRNIGIKGKKVTHSPIFGLALAETHLESFSSLSENQRLTHPVSHPDIRGPDGAGARLQGAAYRNQRQGQVPQGRGPDVATHRKHPAHRGPEWPPGHGGPAGGHQGVNGAEKMGRISPREGSITPS